jgi:hypothetical protein
MTHGQKLGPYEIVSLLGKGGTVEVWRARDSRDLSPLKLILGNC